MIPLSHYRQSSRKTKEKAVAFLLGCSLLSGVAAKEITLSPQKLSEVNQSEQLKSFVQGLPAMKADDMAKTINQLKQLSTADAEKESMLYRAILQSRQLSPNQQLKDELHALTQFQSKTFTTIEENGHQLTVPAFAIAAASKGTLKLWQDNSDSANLFKSIQQGDYLSIHNWLSQNNAARFSPVITQLTQQLSTEQASATLQFLNTNDSLSKAVNPARESLQLQLALKLADREQVSLAVQQISGGNYADEFKQVTTAFNSHDALDIIIHGLKNPVVAAQLLYLSNTQLSDDNSRLALWLPLLNDKALGGTAAQLFAENYSPVFGDSLQKQIQEHPRSLRAKRALLALGSSNSPDARQRLQNLLNDNRLTSQQVREVQQWLN